MINRREFVILGAAGLTTLPFRTFASSHDELVSAMHSSNLIYLTPIKGDGAESSCQSEIWFVADGETMYVVTSADSWRAVAASKGISRTRIWVGDLGNWKKSKGKYKNLPNSEANSAIVSDASTHEKVLGLYANKYTKEWPNWESQFIDGLADKTRSMIRYTLA